MAKFRINYRMKKRGFVDGFSLVVFIIVAGSLATATYLLIEDEKKLDISDYQYFGDGDTNKFYDIDCINKIQMRNGILFESRESAEKFNFTYTECPK